VPIEQEVLPGRQILADQLPAMDGLSIGWLEHPDVWMNLSSETLDVDALLAVAQGLREPT
jgi:hypothetical protein